jgi:hypothetical protein
VLGPFDQEKLQGLARRGQLSRMHELSTDGVSWVRASNFPELFTGGQSELPSLPQSAHAGAGIGFGNAPGAPDEIRSQPAVGSPPATPGGPQAKWFYNSGGQQQGPVDFSDLQLLAGLGQIGPLDQVWTEGMAAWTPASQIQGLIRSGGLAGSSAAAMADAANAPLTRTLCRSAADSRGWALCIASIMQLCGVASVVLGVMVLIVGARDRSPGSVSYGIFCLLHALVIIVGGTLLSTYAMRLGKLRNSPEAIVLERALDALRNFWIFVSMYLIVWLAFIVVFAIAIFAYGITLPQFPL